MTGLTGALVAQVASSSLQLQYMPTIHWVVPGLCTASLIVGFLCVHYSFLLHYSLTRWGSARALRIAFSTRKGTPAGAGGDLVEGGPRGGEGKGSTGVGTAEQAEEERASEPLPSYQTVLTLSLPPYLLVLAIILYMATIFMYWGIAGVTDLQGSGGRSWGVGLHVLKLSSALQADNEFLDHGILPGGNMDGLRCLGGGVWGVWG